MTTARRLQAATIPAVAAEIDRYLSTGDTDASRSAWRSESFLERARQAHDDLRAALIAEVRGRSAGVALSDLPIPGDTVALTRRKTEPMVRGLFPRTEQATVLALVERSVVFVTPDNIDAVLRKEPWDGSAWDLANLYLGSIGAEPLGRDPAGIVGLSQEAICYVSLAYFDQEDPFADFVVHEVAHIFHNCQRQAAGLPFRRGREWMLDVEYSRRETFAYSCEAFARIVEPAASAADRVTLAREFGECFEAGDERVDAAEVAEIVLEAAGRQNGWQVILGRCAPARRRQRPRLEA